MIRAKAVSFVHCGPPSVHMLTSCTLNSESALSLQLFDLVYREETLLNVIKSVTRNGRSIVLTAVLALILVYLFSIVGYIFFKDDFILAVDRIPNKTLGTLKYGSSHPLPRMNINYLPSMNQTAKTLKNERFSLAQTHTENLLKKSQSEAKEYSEFVSRSICVQRQSVL